MTPGSIGSRIWQYIYKRKPAQILLNYEQSLQIPLHIGEEEITNENRHRRPNRWDTRKRAKTYTILWSNQIKNNKRCLLEIVIQIQYWMKTLLLRYQTQTVREDQIHKSKWVDQDWLSSMSESESRIDPIVSSNSHNRGTDCFKGRSNSSLSVTT